MSAYDELLDKLREHGTVKETGQDKAEAQCPAHDDTRPSLSVGTRRDGKGAVICCHAGCATADIVAAIDWTMSDLFDDPTLRATYNGHNVVYDYPGGRKVHRKTGKKFHQSGNTDDLSLFHADLIGDTQTVYVAEGEKDVLAIEAAGGVAVCPPMGAGQRHLDRYDWTVLRGLQVIVVADKDDAGRKHAAQVAELLRGIAASAQIVEAAAGKDAADHIAADRTLNEFVPAATSDGLPRVWWVNDLKPAVQPRWLARNRIPRGAVSLLIGDEGIGKSLLWVLIVAAITIGKAMREFGIPAREPGHVVIAAITEDDWQTVVLPRLIVAGADLDMIRVICTDDDGSGAPIFPRDMHLITEADPRPDLVVVDAWLDTVPSGLQVRDTQQARQALHPWKEAATVLDAALLLLCHTNRVDSANARDRYGATIALRQKARMTLFAQQNEEGQLVVGPEKSNGSTATTATLFTIGAVQHFEPTDDHDGTVPLLAVLCESTQTAREVLADTYKAGREAAAGSSDTIGWLAIFLADGPQRATDVYTAAEEAGYSKDQAKRAKIKLNVKAARETYNGPWFWALPQHSGSSQGAPRTPSLRTPLPDSEPLPDSFTGSASTSQDSLRANGERWETAPLPDFDPSRPKFEPPVGAGRCWQCGCHIKTHGHAPHCQQTTTDRKTS